LLEFFTPPKKNQLFTKKEAHRAHEVEEFAPEKMMIGRGSGFLLGFGNFSGANC